MESHSTSGSGNQQADIRNPFSGRKRVSLPGLLFIALAGALILYNFWSVKLVPFHPDESTYLFMSSDFEALLQDPLSLVWEADKAGDPRQH